MPSLCPINRANKTHINIDRQQEEQCNKATQQLSNSATIKANFDRKHLKRIYHNIGKKKFMKLQNQNLPSFPANYSISASEYTLHRQGTYFTSSSTISSLYTKGKKYTKEKTDGIITTSSLNLKP